MYLAIDARESLREKKTGKGAWASGFVQELKRQHVDLTLFTLSHLKTIRMLLKLKPDFYISPTSYIVPALIGRWIPCVIVVHDLIAFQNNRHEVKARLIERLTLQRALKHAALVCTVSEATKEDLLKRFQWVDDKVTVVYAGSTIAMTNDQCSMTNQCPIPNAQSPKIILCIGTLCPRKNQLRLIEAFEKVVPPFDSAQGDIPFDSAQGDTSPCHGTHLILAGGRGWNDEEIVKKAKETPGVMWLGHVSDERYRELLASATIFAFPSLNEGFGLPVLDAMTMGVPVLTSDRGGLKEVAGDAALYVDPADTDSIAEGLNRMLTDEKLRIDLVANGRRQAEKFSWERTVNIFLKAID